MKKYIYLLLIPVIILACSKRQNKTLFQAVYNGNLDDVKYFVENGVDINAPIHKDRTALYIAVIEQKKDIVQYLINNGATINKLYNKKVFGGHTVLEEPTLTPEIAKMLIDKGADVNLRGKISSPLNIWIYRIRYDMVELLLKHGADVKAKNSRNRTPFDIAKDITDKKERKKMLKLLYKYTKNK
jgi:ankyrin repeat protein